MRSCLFQSSERSRLQEFLRGAAADGDRMRLLQQETGVELALEAAHSLEWDRCSSSMPVSITPHYSELHGDRTVQIALENESLSCQGRVIKAGLVLQL